MFLGLPIAGVLDRVLPSALYAIHGTPAARVLHLPLVELLHPDLALSLRRSLTFYRRVSAIFLSYMRTALVETKGLDGPAAQLWRRRPFKFEAASDYALARVALTLSGCTVQLQRAP